MTALCLVAAMQTAPNPYLLGIGRRGSVKIEPGQLYDMRSGKPATLPDVVRAALGKQFVFLGEEHATSAHQNLEAALVTALAATRPVTVGMEMFTRPKQDVLDEWSQGKLLEADFLTKVDWQSQWGFPYEFYRPVLEAVRTGKLRLVALNIPRDWVHVTAVHGLDNLPSSAKIQLPTDMFRGNKEHRTIYDALVGPHEMPGVKPDNMYAAQVLWDEAMADTALKVRSVFPPMPGEAFVVIAGSGHVMYGQGINYRVARRRGGKGLSVVMLESDAPLEVSRGIGDFVLVSKPVEKK